MALSYDPYGRLHSENGPSGTTRLGYDGVDLVTEYAADGASVLRRYVHGGGIDNPCPCLRCGSFGGIRPPDGC